MIKPKIYTNNYLKIQVVEYETSIDVKWEGKSIHITDFGKGAANGQCAEQKNYHGLSEYVVHEFFDNYADYKNSG